MPSPARTQRRLSLERCRLQARQVPAETLAATLVVVLVMLVLGSTAPAVEQIGWALSLAVVQAARVRCAARFAARRAPRELAGSQACFGVTAALSGLLIGAPASLFSSMLTLDQALALGLIATGWLAATLGMHAAFTIHSLLHGFAVLGQLALAWFQAALPSPILGLAALALYGFLLARMGGLLNAAFKQSTIQAHERRQLVRRLAQASRDERRANQAARRFLACASHDLRQPASSLGLLTNMLRERCSDPTLSPLVQGIERSTAALSELLSSLLDLSRLEAGVVDCRPEWVSVRETFEILQLEFEPRAREKGLILNVSAPASALFCDPILLGRCLRNLLDNALRYTPSGTITLKAFATNDSFKLQVEDTGIGIPPELHSRIFEDHFQIDNAHRDRSRGLGLGLAIVRRLLALMKAGIEVGSDGKHGSRFTIRFPADCARDTSCAAHLDQAKTAGHTGESVLNANAKILLVEDDADVARALCTILTARGHPVDHVFRVEAALHRIYHGSFDVLITDLRLPGQLDGLHLIEHAQQIRPNLRCMLATGDTGTDTLARAHQARVPVLLKPLSAVDVDRALAALLSHTAPCPTPATLIHCAEPAGNSISAF